MLRSVLTWLGGAALVYAALCVVLYVFQRSLLYFPQPARVNAPSLQLSVPDAQLQVSVHERAGPRAVLYFGGNAEDVSASLAELAASFPDHAVYALHYRGYGRSTGSPSEPALQADALAVYDHVASERADITVVGRSLGSGLAVSLAAQRTREPAGAGDALRQHRGGGGAAVRGVPGALADQGPVRRRCPRAAGAAHPPR